MRLKSQTLILTALLLIAPAHLGALEIGPDGIGWAKDEAHARFGRMRSFGFRGSRGMFRPRRSFGTPRSRFGSRNRTFRPIQRPFGRSAFGRGWGFGGGFLGGLGGMLLGGMIGRMLFGYGGYGYGAGGIGLLEIILIGLGIFLLLRFFRGRSDYSYSTPGGRYSASDPYGVGGGSGERGSGPVYRGPDIGGQGSGPVSYHGRGAGPVAETYTAAAPEETGLEEISRSDPSFSRENFLLDSREWFLNFQKAWVDRDMDSIRSRLDNDIYEQCQRDLDALRREGRMNKLENMEMQRLEIAESWQEEGFDFITVRYDVSLLDYVVSVTTGEVVEGNPNTPVQFTEYWTWARRSGPGEWFLSAISQG